MGKKKKGGKAGKAGKAAVAENAVIEFPPELDDMNMLYRKGSFDVRSFRSVGGKDGERKKAEVTPGMQLLRYQQDMAHRAIVPGYKAYLANKGFWMSGDAVPDDAIPSLPAPPKAKAEKKKK